MTVERAVAIAVESFKASNLFGETAEDDKGISEDNLSKLICYLLGECYMRHGLVKFTLYMDLVYVCLIL